MMATTTVNNQAPVLFEMGFLDEMKDKASRIIPTPFAEVVEEATSELLLTPSWERVMLLCDHANAKEENIVDIVRAVRRRIDNKVPKVQYFTVLLTEALIKNCGLPLHIEIAQTKGLLRDLLNLSTKKELTRDGEKEAKHAALTLLLNLSIWFSGHPSEKVKILAGLADNARALGGGFEGIVPDTSVNVNRVASTHSVQQQQQPVQRRAAARQRHRVQAAPVAAGGEAGRIVQAIPIFPVTDEQITGMLEGVMLLVECLNIAEQSNHGHVSGDEAIMNVAAQVRKDYRDLARLISSGAEFSNMDVLLDVCDGQVTALHQLESMVRKEHEASATAAVAAVPVQAVSAELPRGPPPPQLEQPLPERVVAPTQQEQQQPQPSPPLPPTDQKVPNSRTPLLRSAAPSRAPPQAKPEPAKPHVTEAYLDELFGAPTTAQEPSKPICSAADTDAAPSAQAEGPAPTQPAPVNSVPVAAPSVAEAPMPATQMQTRPCNPAPVQDITLRTAMDVEPHPANQVASLNADTPDDAQFEAFLNSRTTGGNPTTQSH